ncbi:KRAB-A domain-containing protein 2-like isoform X2 [Rhopalosiphum padi]|nr:KRAB-A domain-containing protein 2-like isoform X2 [Rhopalosiphum padi]XP_060848295.1 KRAB-A domain-containing protein 2-like isoform X2 [Rhopalosiphum padi]XP_060848297.1 KRAB-A domain-containing protein 2-like isoform X2 [Rhopalosiphum padi]
MIKELGNKYKNITRSDIETFLHFCEPCQQKQKGSKKGVVVKPIISPDFNSRCQVDLIDFQSHPDGKFKFIMVYQDHLTKFVVLKPLEFKRAEEVAYNIIDIFTLLGAPTILQSDNGREFSNQIVSNLRNMWPELKIVHGKPRHSQSQGSVERANQDIENMLTTWMQDEKNRHWSEGLRFIQLMKNRAYHSGIKMSPYEALFGCKIKIGLNTSNLPHDVISTIENEEQLAELITEQSQKVENEVSADTEHITEQPQNIENEVSADTEHITEQPQNIENEVTETEKITEQPQNIENEALHTEQQLATTIKLNNENANIMRTRAKENLENQAKKMMAWSDKKLLPVAIHSTVRVPVPEVDKGRLDARSILAIVLEVTSDGFYRLGTRDGILKQLYARSQFTVCQKKLLQIDEVPIETEVALRTVAKEQSTGTGQGFFKCICKTKCQNKKCICLKNNVLCTSKCHFSTTCCNK